MPTHIIINLRVHSVTASRILHRKCSPRNRAVSSYGRSYIPSKHDLGQWLIFPVTPKLYHVTCAWERSTAPARLSGDIITGCVTSVLTWDS
jgi:hypothetical protein